MTKSSTVNAPLPPGALITFLQKGLQYLAIEEHLTSDGGERLCDGDFGLLSPNTCEALVGGGQAGVGVGGVESYPNEQEVQEVQEAQPAQPVVVQVSEERSDELTEERSDELTEERSDEFTEERTDELTEERSDE